MALPDILARPHHALELKLVDPAGTFNVDITTDKAAATTSIQTLFDDYRTALQADYPPDFASAVTAINQLETDTIAALNANIPDDAQGSTSTALDAVYAAYDALEISEGYDKFCPQCSSTGVAVDVNGEQIECPLSNGYNHTVNQYYADPNSIVYTEIAP